MSEVSPLRLNLLRLGYLILVLGLGALIWPEILNPAKTWSLMGGVVASMLGALAVLSLLGFFHPLKMLPLLLFEMTWKAIWLTRIALPLWASGRLDPDTAETASQCLLIIVFLFLIPWRYLFGTFVRAPSEPWRRSNSSLPRPRFKPIL
ncbi:MAG TPA: hypothetical protein VGF71_18825 [Caulobacteraceae bacterium]|jgi:hypothetical protein